MPAPVGLVAGIGSLLALVGIYLDDAWHTDVGRDGFFSPPHIVLYAGVLVTSLSVLVWAWSSWRSAGGGITGAAAVLRSPSIWIAGVGGVTTLLSAPLDDAWHRLFGRDAVLWSPPHLAAVAGTAALAVGVLAGLRRAPGRWGGPARVLAGVAVVGAFQAAVLEYDSDVPQFSAFWYLPVAALGVCLAVAVLGDLLPGRTSLLQVGLAYTALRLVVLTLLVISGSSLTAVPPVVLALAVAGLMNGRVHPAARLVLVGAAVPLLWWPVLVVQAPVPTPVGLDSLPWALALSAAAGLGVALVHGDLSWRAGPIRAGAVGTLLAAVTLSGPTPDAIAHDPGQGPSVAAVRIEVARSGAEATLDVRTNEPCPAAESIRTVARRAGAERSGPLAAQATPTGCVLSGSVDRLDPGRWFLYAELTATSGAVEEVWLPTPPGTGESAAERDLYEVSPQRRPPWRTAAEGLLLTAVLAILVACLHLSRRAAIGTERPGP